MILFSHHRGGLPSDRFRSLEYHWTIARVQLLSMNLATCLAKQNFSFRYSTITSFTPLCYRITSLRTCNDIPSMDLSLTLYVVTSHYYSFVVAHVSLAYKIAGIIYIYITQSRGSFIITASDSSCDSTRVASTPSYTSPAVTLSPWGRGRSPASKLHF